MHNNRNMLLKHEYNIWQAPTDNDRRIKEEWYKAHYHLAGSRDMKLRSKQMTMPDSDHSLSISAVSMQRHLDITSSWRVGAAAG